MTTARLEHNVPHRIGYFKRFWLLGVGVVIAVVLPMRAQQAAATAIQKFEVASIRPSQSYAGCFSITPPNSTHFEARCVTLRLLLSMAFETDYIDGGGHALDKLYDIRATTPNGIPWTTENVRPMLRDMLEQRFGLQVHHSTRELSGYHLVLAKGGPKLEIVDASTVQTGHKAGAPSENFSGGGRIRGRRVNAHQIAGLLSLAIDAPVDDDTQLSGTYNVDFSYSLNDEINPEVPSLFTALQEELGLKLQPGKVTVDNLIVDHINADPTPN
jgi:uncharacterized protein (TIGR03435 family)